MKIICIGKNFIDHIKEFNGEIPSEPVFFLKPDTALLLNGKPFFYPDFSHDLQYETEIVVKICKPGKYIQEKFSHTYYEEISVGIDFTARDLQRNAMKSRNPWEISKAFDQSAVIGKMLNKSLYSDLNQLNFYLKINGEKKQSGNTRDMIFTIDHVISYISRFITLKIGDYLFMGTPSGVGPVQTGDHLEAFIEDKSLLTCEIK